MFRALGLGVRVSDLGVQGLGFRVYGGLRFSISGSGFRVLPGL